MKVKEAFFRSVVTQIQDINREKISLLTDAQIENTLLSEQFEFSGMSVDIDEFFDFLDAHDPFELEWGL